MPNQAVPGFWPLQSCSLMTIKALPSDKRGQDACIIVAFREEGGDWFVDTVDTLRWV